MGENGFHFPQIFQKALKKLPKAEFYTLKNTTSIPITLLWKYPNPPGQVSYLYVKDNEMNTFNIDSFRALDANPDRTLQRFQAYTEGMESLFLHVFRKADGTPYKPSDTKKKAVLLFKGERT